MELHGPVDKPGAAFLGWILNTGFSEPLVLQEAV